MPDQPEQNDAGAVWRAQPEEKHPVTMQQLMNRRTRELCSKTRAEIIMSIGAALFFIAVIIWRLGLAQDRSSQLGLLAVVAWILISLYRFRDRIWRAEPLPRDALAATGVEFYRKELERRRDHLRNAWIWSGPLILSCLILLAIVLGQAFGSAERLLRVVPFLVLLAGWTAFGVWLRRRQARELQREIDEIDPPV